ncbi:MauE/DoxX family redox-associated membrane protein [Flavobacterium cupriresistens]|uniref:MauE/DoxX family redox-associated membrane protein n=1 Tax=Flavobacterium cupriresistens TaxID=2893885 RepID=UPI003D164B19
MPQKPLKFQEITAEIIYYFLIFFLCYTASNKLIKLDSFKTNLIKTTLFSPDQADLFSVLIILLEVVLIVVLIFIKNIGLLFCCLTMLIFTLYISFLRYKGLYEVCGCGGILNGLEYVYHFIINISLIAGSLFSFLTFYSINDEK